MKAKVLIADDHPLFRNALAGIVRAALRPVEIREATDYRETFRVLREGGFGLVFVDLNMPDASGLADLALLKKTWPQVPMVVVSQHEQEDVIRACIGHNASGYIVKSASPASIKQAILKILQGETWTPRGVSLEAAGRAPSLAEKIEHLTPPQLKVFVEMGQGKLNKQIAWELNITEATVKAHITTVFRKLGIQNRAQAVRLAERHRVRDSGPL